MNFTKKAILTLTSISLFSCRERSEPSETAAVKTSSFGGRVAVFDVFDRDKRLTRQALGVLVSARGALMSGLNADETVVLADTPRRGEKYLPLPAAKGSVSFIGLEAQAPLALAPTAVDAVPPLSSQLLVPIELSPRLEKWTSVIMYNDLGYVQARAKMQDGKLKMTQVRHPRSYSKGGLLTLIYDIFFRDLADMPSSLSVANGLKMVKKGGAIISTEVPYDGVVVSSNGWGFTLKNRKQTATVDILAFVGEDNEYKIPVVAKDVYPTFSDFTREDLLPAAVQSAVDTSAVKMQVPRELEREIIKYLGCNE